MKYIKANKYDKEYVRKLIMGPNPIKLLEEMLTLHPIASDENVLDLGCGQGLTSMFLVKECGARVIAADLWISPSDNKKRFDEQGLSSRQIIPIKAEAHALPFADEFFDTVVCVDSYNYFGLDKKYLGKNLLPLVKHGGYIMISVPGLVKDIHDDIPEEMLLSWPPENIAFLHDMAYWRDVLKATEEAEIVYMGEMEGYEECWNDWLSSDNEYAVGDRRAMEAGAGKYMNLISIVLKRK